MDKTVIFAVAGSGKTTRIIESLRIDQRCLVFTYTEENVINLKRKIVSRFGFLPENIKVMTYFTFLHTFCFRPIVGFGMNVKGLGFSELPARDRFKQTQDGYYIDGNGRLYHSRLAKLLIIKDLMGEVCDRIDLFFEMVFVDEVQDFAGNDFNFLLDLSKLRANMLLAGDFRQHTYDTSRDKSVNLGLHDNFASYVQRFRDSGFQVDTSSLSRSQRCSKAVCKFITERLGIPIDTYSERVAHVIDVVSQGQADAIWKQPSIVKLFYQEHFKYQCFSQNWGASKGEDHYDDICVVLNKSTYERYQQGSLSRLPMATLNKLYVALSRSRGNVYLAPYFYFDSYKSGMAAKRNL